MSAVVITLATPFYAVANGEGQSKFQMFLWTLPVAHLE